MSESLLLLMVICLSGVFTARWMLKIVPWQSELALKTVAATALAGAGAALPLLSYHLSSSVVVAIAVVAALYVFGPLAVIGLARARRYPAAIVLLKVLYWTPAARRALRRLLAQVALQQGDGAAVRRLVPPARADALLLSQLYALEEAWQEVLALEPPEGGDNALLARAARVEAYLQLAQLEQAEAELEAMHRAFARTQGPIGFRAVQLSELRLAAERGQLELVKERLKRPPEGVLPHVLLQIAARAAERAEQPYVASKLYQQAYGAAPEALRPQFAAKLRAFGQTPPEVAAPALRWWGTLGLLVAIGLSYAVQLWLEARYGASAAWVAAAFVLNIPGVPEADGLWRMLSYAFLHGGVVHIGFNAWVLFDIGRVYELRRGWGNLLSAFVFGSVLGAYLTLIAQGGEQLILLGASGGILGVVGALLADVMRGEHPQDRLLLRSLLQWMVILIIFSVAIPNVSLWGHVGGIVGGLLWGFIRQGLPPSRQLDDAVGVASVALMGYALLRAALILSQLG